VSNIQRLIRSVAPLLGCIRPRSTLISLRRPSNFNWLASRSSSSAMKPTESPGLSKDLVFVRELFVKALTGVDAWHRPQPQPITISIWLHTDVLRAGSTDHLTYSLNYDVISRNVTRMAESGKFRTLEEVASKVAESVLADSTGGQWATIHVKKPRALLRAESSEIVISRRKVSTIDGGYEIIQAEGTDDVVKIHKLRLVTIIGVNTIERMHKQNVVIDLTLYKPKQSHWSEEAGYDKHYDFREVVEAVSSHVEDSSYKTVEAFVTSIAQVVCKFGVEKVTVRAEKPSAITFAEAAGVEITRRRETFDGDHSPVLVASRSGSASELKLFPDSGSLSREKSCHDVYIAFGSNEGDPLANIRHAMAELEAHAVKVVATSSLYLSEPMFYVDQNKFHNGVFKCQTTLEPLVLLDALKDIETNKLARKKVMDNGPRTIDLDILLYDDLVMNHPRLNIPHIGMLSRSFVLQPLVELVPSDTLHPLTAESFHDHLAEIPPSSDVQLSSALKSCIPVPFAQDLVYDPIHHTCKTGIMAILNVTPDSFSDGGTIDKDNIIEAAVNFVAKGASILDVGGMSTNPDSTDPGVDEELRRVVPAIEALRKCEALKSIAISVDTFRSDVARAALAAGADIINDVSAGQLDTQMFAVAKEFKAPIILNHTRGTPQEMNKLAHYSVPDSKIPDNSDEAVIEMVGKELEDRVNQAVAAGLPRWQLILDPGIGFAKRLEHNMAIIRNFDKLREREGLAGLVWLLGTSRKRFIGTITGKLVPSERMMGTAATVTALIAGGADIVRIHDVAEMADVVKMSDAIYRNII
jgi:dihydroneopterin aldolase/2-amino-4-hydroxy-6-hydroxymethyldihydropteridine diphosphokinase/dihydropteroate synthase